MYTSWHWDLHRLGQRRTGHNHLRFPSIHIHLPDACTTRKPDPSHNPLCLLHHGKRTRFTCDRFRLFHLTDLPDGHRLPTRIRRRRTRFRLVADFKVRGRPPGLLLKVVEELRLKPSPVRRQVGLRKFSLTPLAQKLQVTRSPRLLPHLRDALGVRGIFPGAAEHLLAELLQVLGHFRLTVLLRRCLLLLGHLLLRLGLRGLHRGGHDVQPLCQECWSLDGTAQRGIAPGQMNLHGRSLVNPVLRSNIQAPLTLHVTEINLHVPREQGLQKRHCHSGSHEGENHHSPRHPVTLERSQYRLRSPRLHLQTLCRWQALLPASARGRCQLGHFHPGSHALRVQLCGDRVGWGVTNSALTIPGYSAGAHFPRDCLCAILLSLGCSLHLGKKLECRCVLVVSFQQPPHRGLRVLEIPLVKLRAGLAVQGLRVAGLPEKNSLAGPDSAARVPQLRKSRGHIQVQAPLQVFHPPYREGDQALGAGLAAVLEQPHQVLERVLPGI
mmetsp:Transcript_81250/g.217193  ORF Transcript_81250/g.217193 Transcript_81250/m.217193 type:complete len:497 (+) Transcript_81250:87-1577(+)